MMFTESVTEEARLTFQSQSASHTVQKTGCQGITYVSKSSIFYASLQGIYASVNREQKSIRSNGKLVLLYLGGTH